MQTYSLTKQYNAHIDTATTMLKKENSTPDTTTSLLAKGNHHTDIYGCHFLVSPCTFTPVYTVYKLIQSLFFAYSGTLYQGANIACFFCSLVQYYFCEVCTCWYIWLQLLKFFYCYAAFNSMNISQFVYPFHY